MKRFLLLAIVMALFIGCSQPEQGHDVDSTGRFCFVGNVPVTQVVYRDTSGQYEVSDSYISMQGSLVHVVGDITGDGMYGKTLDIVYAVQE